MNLYGGDIMIKMGSLRFFNKNKEAGDLTTHIDKGEISFAIIPQRGYVWKKDRRSHFVLNMIEGGPTFPIYANKKNGVDYIIDGQQRLRTASSFINNKFCLSQLPLIEIDEGETFDISGKKFNQLPKKIRDAITQYTFEYNYGENLTDDQERIVFIRLNSGKPLTATEMTKAQIIAAKEVVELSKHSVFKKIMNDIALENSKNVSLVMQMYVALFEKNKCMLATAIKKSLEETKITNEQKSFMQNCLDVFDEIYSKICVEKSDIAKKLVIVLKRKIHFIAFIFTISQSLQRNNCDIDKFILWAKHFFESGNEIEKTTISEEYNIGLKQATNSDISVKSRLTIMSNDYQNFVNKEA